MLRRLIALAVLLLTLAAPASVVAQGATPAARADVAGLFDIGGGRKLYLRCTGSGGPTVVIELGLEAARAAWTYVSGKLDDQTRVCTYTRAGLGTSDPPPPGTRTAADAVADLHALLAAAGESGPYVLVGHSFGGLIVQLYAATFPTEVAGLVLVESVPPGFYDPYFAQFPDDAAKDKPSLSGGNREHMDLIASAAEVGAASIPAVPTVVLARDPASADGDPVEPLWQTAQAEMARHLGAHFQVVTGSGHDLYLDAPQVVIDAVLSVVNAARDPDNWFSATPVAATTNWSSAIAS